MSGREGYVARRGGGGRQGFRRPPGPVRSFVALPCPSGLRAAIAEAGRAWRALPADVSWADPAKIHLTLRFLGDASPARLEALHARLSSTARAAAPVEIAPGSTGAFPGRGRPRVLWVGLADPEPIERLAGAVEEDARTAGFESDERPFTAHLTVGRVKGGRGVRAAVEAVRSWKVEIESEEVDEMVLYESRLSPDGATHVPLATYALGGGA